MAHEFLSLRAIFSLKGRNLGATAKKEPLARTNVICKFGGTLTPNLGCDPICVFSVLRAAIARNRNGQDLGALGFNEAHASHIPNNRNFNHTLVWF